MLHLRHAFNATFKPVFEIELRNETILSIEEISSSHQFPVKYAKSERESFQLRAPFEVSYRIERMINLEQASLSP